VLTDPRVVSAFLTVPRHLFLPAIDVERVYRDEAIPTKLADGIPISSSSQPAIMAIMLEQLDVRAGHRILEIGAGTGYNAALLAELAGPSGRVTAVDLDEDIVQEAQAHLAAAGVAGVRVVRGDGGLGWPEDAPYDRVILTVGAPDVLPAWRDQLRPGGVLVLPLSLRGPQVSVAFEHRGGHLVSRSVKPCGFMALRGAFAGDEVMHRLGPGPGFAVIADSRQMAGADALYAALTGPGADLYAPISLTAREAFDGFRLWLALHEPGFCTISSTAGAAPVSLGPLPFRWSGDSGATIGLVDGSEVCLLLGPADARPGNTEASEAAAPGFRPLVRSFPAGGRLAECLVTQMAAWDRAGRPRTESLSISAYTTDTPDADLPGGIRLDNRHSRLVAAFG
jgi:protein-L-isoaspartate(D-aspartate) O-methyltransferase